jgi:CheY-like chemotaxis protein
MSNILIVDDHPAVRKALRRFFEDTHWAECSEAVDGRDAIEKAQQLHPDVILLDLSMPTMNGIEAAKTLKQIRPEVPIVMLTAYCGTATDLLAQQAGITAVFSKDDVIPLVQRIRAVLDHPKDEAQR